jgi:hypothetical protein
MNPTAIERLYRDHVIFYRASFHPTQRFSDKPSLAAVFG